MTGHRRSNNIGIHRIAEAKCQDDHPSLLTAAVFYSLDSVIGELLGIFCSTLFGKLTSGFCVKYDRSSH